MVSKKGDISLNYMNKIILLETEFDIKKAKSTDPWSYLTNQTKFSSSNISGIWHSLYLLLLVVGVAGLLITFTLAALKYSSKSPMKRHQAKEDMKFKFIVAVVMFGFSTITGVIMTVFNAFL